MHVESTENVSHSTLALPSNKPQVQSSHVINPREAAAWALVVMLVVLLSVSLVIIGILAVWTYRRRNRKAPDGALPMDSNPCYEASTVKQSEAQEAVHVYETVKQHK